MTLMRPEDIRPRRSPDVESRPFPGEGAGAGMGDPGRRGAPPAAVWQLPAPTYFQPPGGQTLRLQGRQDLQVLADGEVTLARRQLQGGEVGVIRIINTGITNLLATSDITFRIKVAGAVVGGWQWQPFAVALAAFAQEFPPESTLIEISEASLISITAEVADAGAYNIDMMIQGWTYGTALRTDFDNAWRRGIR